MDPWGMYAVGKKEKKKKEWGSITGDPWGQVQSNKKKGGKQNRPVSWESSNGSIAWDLWDLSTGSRWSTTYNVGPMRAVNGTTMVGNVEP